MKEGYYDPNGMTILRYDSGAVYRGELRDGKPYGWGVMTYSFGNAFVGTWKHGQVVNGKWRSGVSAAGDDIDGQQPHISFALIGLPSPSEKDAANMRIRIGLSPENCKHGAAPSSDDTNLIQDFLGDWLTAFHASPTNVTTQEKFQSAHYATSRKYYNVWRKLDMMEQIKKCLFAGGTQSILQGVLWAYYSFGKVQSKAAIACYFDQYVDVFLKKTQSTMNWAKITKLGCASEEHTLVKYFRSHIPCSCLDGVHREMKEMRGKMTGDAEGGTLEAKFQELNVDDKDDDDDAEVSPCSHGLTNGGLKMEEIRICGEFQTEFINQMNRQFADGAPVTEALKAVNEGTREKYYDVWTNLAMMEKVIAWFVCQGTFSLLGGDDYSAKRKAMVACYFEEWLACAVHETSSIIDWSKVLVLDNPDQNTLIRFLKTRIPCSCLDAKYKEVRSTTKMGICMNPECSLPEKKVELSEMKHCTRCRRASYCSRRCQKLHWSVHKDLCTQIEFRDAERTSQNFLLNHWDGEFIVWKQGAEDSEEMKQVAAAHEILFKNHPLLSAVKEEEKK